MRSIFTGRSYCSNYIVNKNIAYGMVIVLGIQGQKPRSSNITSFTKLYQCAHEYEV